MTQRAPESAMRRGTWIPALAVLAAGAVAIQLFAAVVVTSTISRGDPVGDWVSFYAAGTLVREGDAARLFDAGRQEAAQEAIFGRDLVVNGYPLPAFVACLFAPLTLLSFVQSYWLWFAVNVCALAGLAAWAWNELKARSPRVRTFVIAAVGLSTPMLYVLVLGQVDLFIVASLLGGMTMLRRDRPFTAGCLLAAAVAKPHVVAAAVVFLLVKREWRALAGFTAVALPLLVVPVFAFGPGIITDQARLIFAYPGSSTDYNVAAEMMVNVRGLIVSATTSSSPWLWLPPLVVIGVTAIALAARVWSRNTVTARQSWAIVFVLPLLYSPHAHIQMLVLFLVAAVLYAASDDNAQPMLRPEMVLIAFVSITTLWLLSVALVSLLIIVPMAAFALVLGRWPAGEAAIDAEDERDPGLAA